jgi:serine/threonine protein kinase
MKMNKQQAPGVDFMGSLEGQQLGQYRIVEQMGQGGMATVFKGYHARLNRTVAIKMMHQAFLEDQGFLARFEREAQIVARLDHPHIVPIFDFADYEGRPYLVMKYVEGKTLKAVLERGSMPLNEILRILPPLAGALDYAHRQGVLHRDIKPSNIIIDANGVPYLTDFGLARMAELGESTLSHDALLGTPHYISPEQALGKRDLDSRTDLYSLGVVLYELVVGRVPFSADTPYAIIRDHVDRPLPAPRAINPDVSAEVEAVLQKALAKNPAERYATATEMIDDFRRAVEGSGMKTLNPNRAAFAEQSIAQYRKAQDNEPTVNLPAAPMVEKPKRDESTAPARRVVERSFDFGNIGRTIEQAGEAIGEALEDLGSKDDDLDLRDDEQAIRRRVEREFKKRSEFTMHAIMFALVNLLLWGIYLLAGGQPGDLGELARSFPWPLIVSFGWGSGLAAHAIETHYETGARAARRIRIVRDELYRLYGSDWSSVNRRELRRVRKRIESPIKKRQEFIQHASVYVLISLMLWVIFYMGSGLPLGLSELNLFPWPLIVMGAWGIGLAAHAMDTFGAGRQERAIQRAVEREREQQWADEKPKRDFDDDEARQIRLTGDGELTDSVVEQWERDERGKRSRR